MFPNPTSESINITFKENNSSQIVLYYAMESAVPRVDLLEGIKFTQLDVSNLATSIYVLSIGEEQQKVVVE